MLMMGTERTVTREFFLTPVRRHLVDLDRKSIPFFAYFGLRLEGRPGQSAISAGQFGNDSAAVSSMR
ncbi:hypothetical protein Zmor_003468 [Zophobas morio]|uniref:Uncharacterized protein n=1 Tax=Zophobas morio TaxID=2755281 RepID=A0AA38HP67_9CUCU|nr:hypothetical protein Zmor_003468 [Zophobas morio]